MLSLAHPPASPESQIRATVITALHGQFFLAAVIAPAGVGGDAMMAALDGLRDFAGRYGAGAPPDHAALRSLLGQFGAGLGRSLAPLIDGASIDEVNKAIGLLDLTADQICHIARLYPPGEQRELRRAAHHLCGSISETVKGLEGTLEQATSKRPRATGLQTIRDVVAEATAGLEADFSIWGERLAVMLEGERGSPAAP